MTNSFWWARAKLPPRAQPIEIRKRELLATLRKGNHAVTLEKRCVYGVVDAYGGALSIGDELILSVNVPGDWQRFHVDSHS